MKYVIRRHSHSNTDGVLNPDSKFRITCVQRYLLQVLHERNYNISTVDQMTDHSRLIINIWVSCVGSKHPINKRIPQKVRYIE